MGIWTHFLMTVVLLISAATLIIENHYSVASRSTISNNRTHKTIIYDATRTYKRQTNHTHKTIVYG